MKKLQVHGVHGLLSADDPYGICLPQDATAHGAC